MRTIILYFNLSRLTVASVALVFCCVFVHVLRPLAGAAFLGFNTNSPVTVNWEGRPRDADLWNLYLTSEWLIEIKKSIFQERQGQEDSIATHIHLAFIETHTQTFKSRSGYRISNWFQGRCPILPLSKIEPKASNGIQWIIQPFCGPLPEIHLFDVSSCVPASLTIRIITTACPATPPPRPLKFGHITKQQKKWVESKSGFFFAGQRIPPQSLIFSPYFDFLSFSFLMNPGVRSGAPLSRVCIGPLMQKVWFPPSAAFLSTSPLLPLSAPISSH